MCTEWLKRTCRIGMGLRSSGRREVGSSDLVVQAPFRAFLFVILRLLDTKDGVMVSYNQKRRPDRAGPAEEDWL